MSIYWVSFNSTTSLPLNKATSRKSVVPQYYKSCTCGQFWLVVQPRVDLGSLWRPFLHGFHLIKKLGVVQRVVAKSGGVTVTEQHVMCIYRFSFNSTIKAFPWTKQLLVARVLCPNIINLAHVANSGWLSNEEQAWPWLILETIFASTIICNWISLGKKVTNIICGWFWLAVKFWPILERSLPTWQSQ